MTVDRIRHLAREELAARGVDYVLRTYPSGYVTVTSAGGVAADFFPATETETATRDLLRTLAGRAG